MEAWFIILVSIGSVMLIRAIISLFTPSSFTNNTKTPPGPSSIPIITSFTWLFKSIEEIELILPNLVAKYGPIITIRIASRPSIFIADHSLAHHALIQNGQVFSDRPNSPATGKIISSNQRNISSAAYGDTWRTLRRNLTSEILHNSRVKSFSGIRHSVLQTLLTRLKSDSNSNHSVKVIDHIHYAMFCLLVFMCFGERVTDEKIADIERVMRQLLLGLNRFQILNLWPKITRILFHQRWEDLLRVRKEQEEVLVPLIRARKQVKEGGTDDDFVLSYVDTLLELQLPEEKEKRKLTEGEIVTLCTEFLSAGTDTTSTSLEWILANLVKNPHVQERLVEEIKEVLGEREDKEVKEEDLQNMPYLKAVILEGLRRHPPGHFVLPHTVTKDVVLNDYLIPKNGTVNFMVAEMGRDPKIWEDPMAFKPERFLNDEQFDITGSKGIKMMPFGVGRRICPAYNLAMLHLEYFVANLIWNLEWKVPEGGHVDLSEKPEFTVVMKNALQAHLSPRV
ncbi:hypothetical protein VNO77_04648 [Canavalia gladiata]|uniref:Cytochrome P450 n=1 Tax=Canavalia gladiata TaxID=3824 RepID=A0AAN9MXJ1_CANGL